MEANAHLFSIADACPDCTHGLAMVNFTAWQETYRNIIHDSFINSLNLETYVERWERILAGNAKSRFVLVAKSTDGEIAGYCMGGRVQQPFKQFEGEIYALYLLKKYHGKGVGGRLFREAMLRLQQMNFNSACLFVLRNNPTIDFYRHFKPDFETTTTVQIDGKEYDDVALGWSRLTSVSV